MTLIRREGHFAKSAMGWLLRDISKHDQAFVERFIQEQSYYFYDESVRNATKYFDNQLHPELIKLIKMT
jgi:3-methyladenine DNA glycosylase AlkD